MSSSAKQYDIFICYSSADKMAVSEIAERLKRRGLKIWLDEWAIKPGDLLLEKIENGIAGAQYFLAFISTHSVDSRWVKHELASGMSLEIAGKEVRVVPALMGAMDFSGLPASLSGKNCLDFRTEGAIIASIEKLVDLVDPERRVRKELLKELRRPDSLDGATFSKLCRYAHHHRDQTLEVAALKGLVQFPGTPAVLEITRRSLHEWGMQTIGTAINLLGKRAEDGGLLALTSTCLMDLRFYVQKLKEISKVIGPDALPYSFETVRHTSLMEYMLIEDALSEKVDVVRELQWHENPDIANGALLALWSMRQHRIGSVSLEINKKQLDAAMNFGADRLPGLTDLLKAGPDSPVRHR
ncbi:toll/interleukin-1 receptor domain-containing protein [Nonomuraea sp. NPDC051191]|uniref:toll/interleukin-1 receptor domain-containing protein n=1 Tax=Nonomuraea sp. NPDC051191 TaxID=3364372 RepID=UPI0037A097D2